MATVIRVTIECANKMNCGFFEDCHKREKAVLVDRRQRVLRCSECADQPTSPEKGMAKKRPKRKGRVPVKFMERIEKLSLTGSRTWSFSEICSTLGLHWSAAGPFLTTAVRKGFAKRIARGKYLIPIK